MSGEDPSLPTKKDDGLVTLAKYSHLGLVLPAGALAGFLLGYGLDRLFHSHFMVWVGLALGVFAGFYDLIRAAVQIGKE